MTFNQRMVKHNHRGMVVARQGKETSTVPPKPTPTKVIVPPRKPTVPPKSSVVSATSVSASPTSTPAVPTSASVSSSVSASPTSTLSVSPPPLSLSVVTPSTISTTARAIPTPPIIPTSSISAVASSSTSNAPDSAGGLSTGSLIGIIGGCIGAVAVIGLVIAFFLRRLRNKKTREGFDPTKFRRSAIMLDDKDEKAGLRPRPPTMIERRKVHATSSAMAGNLPAPSMAFPYSDQMPPAASRPLYENGHPQSFAHYGASDTQSYGTVPPPVPPSGYSRIPGAYGVPPPLFPYNGAQYEQAGYGAPPIPGVYGPSAYAAYGPDPRYPQYQHQHQGYPHFPPQPQALQYTQPQQTFGYGNPNVQHRSASVNPALSNPSPNVSPSAALAQPPSSLTEKQRLHLATTIGASSSSSSSSLTRQPTQSSGAPPAYVDADDSRWDISRKDIKCRPKEMNVTNNVGEQAVGSSSAPAITTTATPSPPVPETTINERAQPNSTGARPTSAYTLYDQDDAYGGM